MQNNCINDLNQLLLLTMNRKSWLILIAVSVFGWFSYVLSMHLLKNRDLQAHASVRVVAAENFWGDIAKQIGASHVSVTSIIDDPSSDPHLYESNARDAAVLAAANVVIENGLGYDDFMDKLLAASPNSSRQNLSVAKILNASSNANPHLWYDLQRVPEAAAKMELAMEVADPTHKADYQANLKAFDNSLKPILEAIAMIKLRHAGAPVAYTERVPGYLLEAAGLSIKTPTGFAQSIEDGNDPSPADALAMEQLISGHQIKVLIYNSQATSPVSLHIRELATKAGIPVIGVSETLPKSEKNYQSWQLDQVSQLRQALDKT